MRLLLSLLLFLGWPIAAGQNIGWPLIAGNLIYEHGRVVGAVFDNGPGLPVEGILSPDARFLACAYFLTDSYGRTERVELRVVDRQTRAGTLVATSDATILFNWTPAGQLFIDMRGGPGSLFLTTPGTWEKQPIPEPEGMIRPVFPYIGRDRIDGRPCLIYTRPDPGGGLAVMLKSIEGGYIVHLASVPNDSEVVLSPDGEWIASILIGGREVRLTSTVGSASRVIAKPRVQVGFLFWSPDSQYVGAKLLHDNPEKRGYVAFDRETGRKVSVVASPAHFAVHWTRSYSI